MILDVIVEDKKKRLKEHKARTSEEQMKELALVSERKSISFWDDFAERHKKPRRANSPSLLRSQPPRRGGLEASLLEGGDIAQR